MTSNPISQVQARRRFLAGPTVSLLRQLADRRLISPDVFISRDGLRACLLGHLARTPMLRADGWQAVNGIPHWAGYMGVAAAQAYCRLGREQALDIFGNRRESRADSVEQRLRLMAAILAARDSAPLQRTG